MKLHYMGKFNLDQDSLPQAEHKPGAVEFKEADSMKKLSVIANAVACIILVILGAAAFFRIVPVAEPKSATITWFAALLGSIVIIFPHELLHAACFKKDVYLYTNLKQGMLFVIGTETMSKDRFIFMSMLPNIIFGIVLCYRHDFPEVYIPDHVRHDLHKHGRGRLLQCFQRHTASAEERKSLYVRHAVVLVCGRMNENSINS